jgi:hypothetical protein
VNVDLFYLSPNPYGGWVTFTAHLVEALKAVGIKPTLYKIRPRSEKKPRPFGYDLHYTNISLQDALRSPNKKLIVAAAKNHAEDAAALYSAGAALVVHDPTEIKNLPPLKDRIVIIRQVGLQYLPQATFIRHPYQRRTEFEVFNRTTRAISTSRIDFDKHTALILDANRLVPEEVKCRIYGFENRIYTRFKIVPHYPEWEQSKAAYPRNKEAAFKLLSWAQLAVDMSLIKGDGGGTQYTTLEAWDAGAVPVIQRAWLRPQDDMVENQNCFAVGSAEELAALLMDVGNTSYLDNYREYGYKRLALHSPKVIGEQYRAVLEAI